MQVFQILSDPERIGSDWLSNCEKNIYLSFLCQNSKISRHKSTWKLNQFIGNQWHWFITILCQQFYEYWCIFLWNLCLKARTHIHEVFDYEILNHRTRTFIRFNILGPGKQMETSEKNLSDVHLWTFVQRKRQSLYI